MYTYCRCVYCICVLKMGKRILTLRLLMSYIYIQYTIYIPQVFVLYMCIENGQKDINP